MEIPKLSKETVNIIRTTQRNNIDLTHLADNKANVLLSLNAIMVTFLVPYVLENISSVVDNRLYIPLGILALTCFCTIYISTIVLKPSNLDEYKINPSEDAPLGQFSPFFFGNFYKMEPEEFFEYAHDSFANEELVKAFLIQDLFFVGRRLGFKMNRIRFAYTIFLIGLSLTLFSTAVVVYFF